MSKILWGDLILVSSSFTGKSVGTPRIRPSHERNESGIYAVRFEADRIPKERQSFAADAEENMAVFWNLPELYI